MFDKASPASHAAANITGSSQVCGETASAKVRASGNTMTVGVVRLDGSPDPSRTTVKTATR
jgi:hypothetical protein